MYLKIVYAFGPLTEQLIDIVGRYMNAHNIIILFPLNTDFLKLYIK